MSNVYLLFMISKTNSTVMSTSLFVNSNKFLSTKPSVNLISIVVQALKG